MRCRSCRWRMCGRWGTPAPTRRTDQPRPNSRHRASIRLRAPAPPRDPAGSGFRVSSCADLGPSSGPDPAQLLVLLAALGDVLTEAAVGGERRQLWDLLGRRLDARAVEHALVERVV